MPQMSPMNWIMIMTFMLMMFFFNSIKVYYISHIGMNTKFISIGVNLKFKLLV